MQAGDVAGSGGIPGPGPFWTDGQMLLRVRGVGSEGSRIVRVRRPYAIIGRLPGCDIQIDDPAVSSRHVYLHVDRRGIFGVDLVTRSGTRFQSHPLPYLWLRPGQFIEVAGRQIEVLQFRIDNQVQLPPPCTDEPFAESRDLSLDEVVLEPLDGKAPPWVLGSELVFLGRGDSCAIKVESPSRTHCALLRSPHGAFLIDLLGRPTQVNDRDISQCQQLHEGDILTVGGTTFLVRIQPGAGRTQLALRSSTANDLALPDHGPRGLAVTPGDSPPLLARLVDAYQSTWDTGVPPELAMSETGQLVAWIAGVVQASQGEMIRRQQQFQFDVAEALQRIQSDTSTLLEAHLQRIEAMNKELHTLKDEVKSQGIQPYGPRPPVPEPARLNLPPKSPVQSMQSASWMLDRIKQIENENKSSWRDLLGRLSSLGTRPAAEMPEEGDLDPDEGDMAPDDEVA